MVEATVSQQAANIAWVSSSLADVVESTGFSCAAFLFH